MSNLEALKLLYAAMGGQEDLEGATTLVEVLNAITELGGGEGTATHNAEAIEALAAVVQNIISSGDNEGSNK